MFRSPVCKLPNGEHYEDGDPGPQSIPHVHYCLVLEQILGALRGGCCLDLNRETGVLIEIVKPYACDENPRDATDYCITTKYQLSTIYVDLFQVADSF